jgi:hypothetical protein
MKVLKNAGQKNVILDNDLYSWEQLRDMLNTETIWYFDSDLRVSHDTSLIYWNEYREKEFRVFLEDVEELKVVYNKEWGFYETIAVLKNGIKLHVKL